MKKETERLLRATSKKVDKAREKEAELWAQLRNLMREAYEEGKDDPDDPVTYIEIGEIVGLTKARVYQLISGKRSGRKKEVPELAERVLGKNGAATADYVTSLRESESESIIDRAFPEARLIESKS